MPVKRQFAPRAIEVADVKLGRVDYNYVKVLTRLMAAHALAEQLTAEGYERSLTFVSPGLRSVVEKNAIEERKHAALIYHALEQIGVTRRQAERMMITARKAPSFEAPRYFAEKASDEVDLLMASISLDVTGLIMIGVNYKDSSYAPHSRAAESILEEEAEHDQFSSEVLRDALARVGLEALNHALLEWLPRAVNFFGPPGSGFTFECIRMGLKSKDNSELAELYLSVLERRFAQLGLDMPRLSKEYPCTVIA